MNQNITTTITGFVATEPKYYEAKNEDNSNFITFRMATNKSYFDKAKKEWVDEKTTWFTVKAWNDLAKNIHESVKKADPIMVTGGLTTDEWVDDAGEKHSTLVIEASSMGHNLRFGNSSFTRTSVSSSHSHTKSSKKNDSDFASESTTMQVSIDDGDSVKADSKKKSKKVAVNA